MYKIREWLFVSNYPTAQMSDVLKSHNIGAMLQLFQPIKAKGIETKFIGLQDGIPIKTEQIQDGIQFILKQRKKNRVILSTCGAGVSRSVTMAIIALKEVEGLTLVDAYYDIYKHYNKALPDHVHWQSISDFYGEQTDFWDVWGDITLREIEDDL